MGIGAYFHRSKEDEEMLQVKVCERLFSLSVSVESHAGLAAIGEKSDLDRNIYRKMNLKIMDPFEFLRSI